MFAQSSDFSKLVPNSYQDTLAYRLCTLTSGCGALYIIGLTYYVREYSSVQGIPTVFTPSRYFLESDVCLHCLPIEWL